MKNIYRLIIFLAFVILGCSPNLIEENKVAKEINNLNLNIFSKNGDKKYSIKSPFSTYNNSINKFQFQEFIVVL